MYRRKFHRAVGAVIIIVLCLSEIYADSAKNLTLNKKIDLMLVVPLGTAHKAANIGKEITAVYWCKTDLERVHLSYGSKEIIAINADLKRDHRTDFIALEQGVGSLDFLGQLKDIKGLCAEKTGIEYFAEDYFIEGIVMPEEESPIRNPSEQEIRYRMAPQSKKHPDISFPKMGFLRERFQESRSRNQQAAFLERYRQYVREYSEMIGGLGFNLYMLLDVGSLGETLGKEWIQGFKKNGVGCVLSFSSEGTAPTKSVVDIAKFIFVNSTSIVQKINYLRDDLGFEGLIIVECRREECVPALKAGATQIFCSSVSPGEVRSEIQEAIRKGDLDKRLVDRNAKKILTCN